MHTSSPTVHVSIPGMRGRGVSPKRADMDTYANGKMDRNIAQRLLSSNPARRGLLVLIVVGVILFGVSSLSGGASKAKLQCALTGKRYGLMFDAGSTGSRVHAYEFVYHENGAVELIDELFEQVKPGLSAYANEPKAAANSLRPLLDAAMKKIPAHAAPCTPIELKATAGLRLVGKQQSDAILHAVYELFKTYPFAVAGPESVIVMDGKDEGPYAWMTVNFLLETMSDRSQAKTAAIIDMGGASTQIVFRPDSDTEMAAIGADQSYQVVTESYNARVYTHSHLGYGLKQANRQMMKEAQRREKNKFSCLPKGISEKIDGVEAANVDGEQSFEKCHEVAKSILKKEVKCATHSCSFNGVNQPHLVHAFTGPLYVFSYYYDRMEAFLNAEGVCSVGEIRKVAEGVCAGKESPYAEHNKGTMCMDLTYLYALLSTGYDLPDDKPLYIKKKIKGIETAWSLGAMMVAMKPKF